MISLLIKILSRIMSFMHRQLNARQVSVTTEELGSSLTFFPFFSTQTFFSSQGWCWSLCFQIPAAVVPSFCRLMSIHQLSSLLWKYSPSLTPGSFLSRWAQYKLGTFCSIVWKFWKLVVCFANYVKPLKT